MSYNELQDLNEREEDRKEESINIKESEPQKHKLQESRVVPMTTRSGRTAKIPDKLNL